MYAIRSYYGQHPQAQRQIEFGNEVPHTEASPGTPLTLAQIGRDRRWQCKVGP